MKNRKKLMVIWALVVCFLMGQPVWAQVNNDEKYSIASNEISGWPQGADVYSETAVLIEADTGLVLYDKGKDEPRYPASITKVMTALLALENSSLDEEVTFTETGLERIYEGTNINMQVGEVLTMEQCLYAIMIKSANEVAAQVAEHVGGTQDAFVDMMNAKAQELGCTNTHFNNPSGLPDENHWTTANDMALIFREALKNEEFVKIIGTLSYTIPPTNMNPESRTLTSHHALLVPSAPEYYEGCIGGKTGVTEISKNTLVTAAERDGMCLIAVVMRADAGQVCADTTALFDYGFSQFEKLQVEGGELVIPKGTTEDDLTVTEAEVDGEIVRSYSLGDYTLGVTSVSAEEKEQQEEEAQEAQQEQQQGEQTDSQAEQNAQEEQMNETLRMISRVMAIVILVLIVVAIIRAIYNGVKRKKRRKGKKR
ncbi:MAG: D-alanyl-D-alanine carboxypeptidase family protein [Ruminococcus sp.]|jgi:D-alanyl-D-alanine carboxypeptidase (penicillin-binding protein 5/6)